MFNGRLLIGFCYRIGLDMVLSDNVFQKDGILRVRIESTTRTRTRQDLNITDREHHLEHNIIQAFQANTTHRYKQNQNRILINHPQIHQNRLSMHFLNHAHLEA